jgi:hypothetical protein
VLAGGVALQLSSDTGTSGGDADVAVTAADAAEALAATERAEEPTADVPAADATVSDTGGTLDTGISDQAPPGENVGLDQLESLDDLADFAAAAVGAPAAPDDVTAATSAESNEDLSEAETLLAESELPVCLGVDVIVGPAVYGDVPVVVGIDESRNLAIAYRAANCAEVARVRLP